MKLPRSLDELHGLRAARWIRESTAGQYANNGPESQRTQQDRAIQRYGLTDTGIEFAVAESGRTVWRHPQMVAMVEAAQAGRFDVLVAGYSDRWQRNLRRTLELLEDQLHPAGVAILFADRRILSSDPHDKDDLVFEARAAERYSEVLAERITDGYAAKFATHADQGGNAPLGFRREPDPPRRLVIDPSTIGRAVAAFERYATAEVSLRELEAETDIDRDALRTMLVNPIYNGWVRRYRRSDREERRPAAWRDSPPVSDDLWARVQEVRHDRYHGGGHPTPVHDHLLAGRLFCPDCGARIRADGRRYRHFRPCSAWSQETISAGPFEEGIAAQLQGVRYDAAMLANLRRLATVDAARPDSTRLRRRQLERELADLAQRHARRALSTEAYLAEHLRIGQAIDSLTEDRDGSPVVDPEAAIAYLRDLPRLWRDMSAKGRAALVRSTYSRVLVRPDAFVGIELTPEAQRHGLALALPEKVLVRARPAGFEPAA